MRQVFSESPDEWRKDVEKIKQSDLKIPENQPIELSLSEYKKYKEEIKPKEGESTMDYAIRLKSFPVWKVDSVYLFEDRWRMKYGEDIDNNNTENNKEKQLNLF